MPKTGTLYLLHFARPISPAHTTQHYLGYADDLPARLEQHARRRGARLTQVAVERGIDWLVARIWPGGTPQDERRLKRLKNGSRLCPVCHPGTKRGRL